MSKYPLTRLLLTKRAFATYNYAGAHARDYTPPASKVNPDIVKDESRGILRDVSPKSKIVTDLPKPNGNVDSSIVSGTQYPDGLFSNTISGTGSGRPYWSYPTNPFSP